MKSALRKCTENITLSFSFFFFYYLNAKYALFGDTSEKSYTNFSYSNGQRVGAPLLCLEEGKALGTPHCSPSVHQGELQKSWKGSFHKGTE